MILLYTSICCVQNPVQSSLSLPHLIIQLEDYGFTSLSINFDDPFRFVSEMPYHYWVSEPYQESIDVLYCPLLSLVSAKFWIH